jgi:hypothetical protein
MHRRIRNLRSARLGDAPRMADERLRPIAADDLRAARAKADGAQPAMIAGACRCGCNASVQVTGASRARSCGIDGQFDALPGWTEAIPLPAA